MKSHQLFISMGLNTFSDYIEDLQSEITQLVCLLSNAILSAKA